MCPFVRRPGVEEGINRTFKLTVRRRVAPRDTPPGSSQDGPSLLTSTQGPSTPKPLETEKDGVTGVRNPIKTYRLIPVLTIVVWKGLHPSTSLQSSLSFTSVVTTRSGSVLCPSGTSLTNHDVWTRGDSVIPRRRCTSQKRLSRSSTLPVTLLTSQGPDDE